MAKPELPDVPEYYRNYIEKAEGKDLIDALKTSAENTWSTVYKIPTGFEDHRYAEGKWSIREIFQHIVDSERVFCYRALCFARGEKGDLPGFDHDAYVIESAVAPQSFHKILREHDVVRSATIALFSGFNDELLQREGTANKNRIRVNTIGWVIAGHASHHMQVIAERYLNNT